MEDLIYIRAIEKWGVKSQLEMAQEEAIELALAIRKFIRTPNERTLADLADEIADVDIMINQILRIEPKLITMVKSRKKFKLHRLLARINNEK